MKDYAFIFIFTCLLTIGYNSHSQTPTIQDCMGAIPICQNHYSQLNAYYGAGSYVSEINPAISCLDEEYYSVWYTFTAQTTGLFRFEITPNTYSDDYDWAVFNLTNASCAHIATNASLMVSCNSYGDYNGANGSTGANSANGGVGNSNGPGNTNGPPWNADIPVTAGSTYTMLICNWSRSTSGYSINFNGSTATIFDNIPPAFMNVTSNCGDSSVMLQFSEMVMCNSVQLSDFRIIGPNGDYPLVSAIGPSCAQNAPQDRFFKIKTNQRLQKGNYKLILQGPVNDLCGNTATSDTISFYIDGLNFQTSYTPATCNPNGTATCTPLDGLAPYSYQWSNGQTAITATGLLPSTYYVKVTDARGCIDSTFVVVQSGSGNMDATLEKSDVKCYGQNNGWAKVKMNSGTPPLFFQWSNGMSDSTIHNLSPGTYIVTVSDVYGCMKVDSIEIFQNPPYNLVLDSIHNEICSYANGAIYVHAFGGIPPYRFEWTGFSQENSSQLTQLHAGSYVVTAYDSVGCAQSLTANVDGQPYPIADFSVAPQRSFLDNALFTFTNNSTNSTSSYWDFGDGFYSSDHSPNHRYSFLGHFPITLVVQSENVCFDTLTKFIDVVEDFSLFIPNAFSPNTDGQNDFFGPIMRGANAKDYIFEIYSRWGDLVFYTHDISKLWNGQTLANRECPIGSYIYKIIVLDLCDYPHEYIGTVVLIK